MESLEYHKIHDAYTLLPNGEPLIPIEATKGALCIIRNPLDVAISFAHHNNCSIDKSIKHMGNPEFAMSSGPKRFHLQLRQRLLSWSKHVTSWVDAPNINTQVVRYEDMTQDPIKTFTQIALFLELPSDRNSVIQAIKHSNIDKLQAQEDKTPFKEKPAKAARFFRKGIVGDWQNTLTDRQINRIIHDHRAVMQRFNYLDAQELPCTVIPQRERLLAVAE